MAIEQLGWTRDFSGFFEQTYRHLGYLPARVIRTERDSCLVRGDGGEWSEFYISKAHRKAYLPALGGTYAAWDSPAVVESAVVVMDLATGKEFRIQFDDGHVLQPAVSGDVIVWLHLGSGGLPDVYGARIQADATSGELLIVPLIERDIASSDKSLTLPIIGIAAAVAVLAWVWWKKRRA